MTKRICLAFLALAACKSNDKPAATTPPANTPAPVARNLQPAAPLDHYPTTVKPDESMFDPMLEDGLETPAGLVLADLVHKDNTIELVVSMPDRTRHVPLTFDEEHGRGTLRRVSGGLLVRWDSDGHYLGQNHAEAWLIAWDDAAKKPVQRAHWDGIANPGVEPAWVHGEGDVVSAAP